MLFLINPLNGGSRASEGFGNFIRADAKEAGIEGTRGPHGLRKAGCRRLIEIGCDAQMAISISGHASEKELQPYIRDVNKKMKARQAM
jgi:integrase